MKHIELTRGFVAIVDDADYEYLSQFSWAVLKGATTYYATRTIRVNGKAAKIYMHRQLMNAGEGQLVDHRNRNGLDCRRCNLRLCDKSDNSSNRKPSGAIAYLGVSKHGDRFRAQIFKHGIKTHIGVYDSAIEAAEAYNEYAKRIHGQFANLNAIAS